MIAGVPHKASLQPIFNTKNWNVAQVLLIVYNHETTSTTLLIMETEILTFRGEAVLSGQ